MATLLDLPELHVVRTLSPDGRLLFVTRIVRLFAYGFLSIVLAFYLTERGLNEHAIGQLFTWALVGDAIISLWLTTTADRFGRRRTLIIGAGLIVLAGVIFATTGNVLLLTLAAIVGTLSPSGGEVGPFLSIEQAALTHTTDDKHRTAVFAWYNLAGSLATATGALAGGALAAWLQQTGSTAFASYRTIVLGYALIGLVLGALFTQLSSAVEVDSAKSTVARRTSAVLNPMSGLHRSRRIVLTLSSLFMLDAFAGGLIVQSFLAYWFAVRFGVDPATLGSIFFGTNLLAAGSSLVAARLAARFGLVNTMVWTHIPSNVLLLLLPLMPTLPLAIAVLLARASISQMDVPTRQAYVMSVVAPDERSAAAGVTSVVRSAASAAAPIITGTLFAAAWLSVPFFLAGTLKIVYDLTLYRNFRTARPSSDHS
ncbi:MAG: MFS transporter [Chloroflexota bacterium]|nr:MFS transporter [Chloroflexota bacterium]